MADHKKANGFLSTIILLMLKQNKKHKETGRNKMNPNKQTMKLLKGDGKDA